MDDVRRVKGFQRTKCLVGKILCMIVRKILGADDAVHVRFHQLLDD